MLCCWISPDNNPASTQRCSWRVPNMGLRERREPSAFPSLTARGDMVGPRGLEPLTSTVSIYC